MYEQAKKQYALYGVDVEKALNTLRQIPVSVHCWQGDDVIGLRKFERRHTDDGQLSGSRAQFRGA